MTVRVKHLICWFLPNLTLHKPGQSVFSLKKQNKTERQPGRQIVGYGFVFHHKMLFSQARKCFSQNKCCFYSAHTVKTKCSRYNIPLSMSHVSLGSSPCTDKKNLMWDLSLNWHILQWFDNRLGEWVLNIHKQELFSLSLMPVSCAFYFLFYFLHPCNLP